VKARVSKPNVKISAPTLGSRNRLKLEMIGTRVSFTLPEPVINRPSIICTIPEKIVLEVTFSDLNKFKTLEVYETDTIALLMDDIIATNVYLDNNLEIYELELLVDGDIVSMDRWNWKINDVIAPSARTNLIVFRHKGAEPPFVTKNFSNRDVWKMCTEMRKSYQRRVNREKKLRTMTGNLSLVLRDVPKHFRNLFIEALNAKDDAVQKNGNEKSYSATSLHLIVVFCFQDFLPEEVARNNFIEALGNIIFKARGTNQKLNALRILSL